MHALVIAVHILVCLALIGIVLLQQGKGAEMGAVFGGSSQTLFGSAGATTFLGKLTAAAAGIFMLTCLGLTYLTSNRYKSTIMSDRPAATAPGPTSEATPAAPAPAPAPAEQGAQQPQPASEQPKSE